MPRPIWKGHISFGLVNVPVVLYAAEQKTDLELHMVDSRDHARIRYERVNAETGEEVPWSNISKGFEYSDGNYLILGENELKHAAPEATRTVEIERFVDPAEIEPIYFDKPYYLEPSKGGEKGYVLLRRALEESGLVGITRVVIRTRQYMAMLAPMGDILLLDLLRYDQELKPADELKIPESLPKSQAISTQELKIARQLIESMKGPWDPGEYHDEYRDRLMKWIKERIKKGDIDRYAEAPEEEEADAPAPINFMELLEKSLKRDGAAPAKPHKRAPGSRRAKSHDDDEQAPRRLTTKKPPARRKSA
jgi:DNA end-binding protein Ku